MPTIKIADRTIGDGHPAYFIADIAANHDGDLPRAQRLIELAAKAGADAAKFQHFRAAHIVSDFGFRSLGGQVSHQSKWARPVFEVYQAASVPWEWTETLARTCADCGIHFFSAAYDLEAIDMLEPHVPAYKIGSGDITWIEALEHTARKGKPVLLAAGASEMADVERAVAMITGINPHLLLMQCNTNYTGSLENFRFVNLNVLKTFAAKFPALPLGLSDHTPGCPTALGAIVLGARAIEKHFTDDRARTGPDHAFSMSPADWRDMVDRSRELQAALGDGMKRVEGNESETVVIQRRCLRAARDLSAGSAIARADLDVLRPAPPDSIFPYDLPRAIGRRLRRAIPRGECLKWSDLD